MYVPVDMQNVLDRQVRREGAAAAHGDR